MLYEQILRELDAQEVKYLVIGGIAVNFHGVERITGDLDILISFEEDNLKKFVSAIRSVGWIPRLPVSLEDFCNPANRKRWQQEKGMKVFPIFNPKKPLEHIDVMTENYIDFTKAYQDRKLMMAREITISVISIPDLIKLKKIAGRKRDKLDILGLKQISKHETKKKKKS